jgi:hypothetical protein
VFRGSLISSGPEYPAKRRLFHPWHSYWIAISECHNFHGGAIGSCFAHTSFLSTLRRTGVTSGQFGSKCVIAADLQTRLKILLISRGPRSVGMEKRLWAIPKCRKPGGDSCDADLPVLIRANIRLVDHPLLNSSVYGRRLGGNLRQKHVKVRRRWLGIKLPQHQRDLTSMVGGMVHEVLHQARQTDLCRTKRKHLFQRFICHAICELGLLPLNPRPL